MRIGIDGRTMLNARGGEGAGIGHYTFLLTQHLLRIDRRNEYVIFLDRQINNCTRKEVTGDNPNVTIRHFPFQNAKRALPFIYSHMVLSAAFERARLDILHAPANSLPLFYRAPAVITVHDLAIYDHPEWFPSPYVKSLGFSERIVVPYSVRQARRIIAVSNQTKADLQRVFKLPEGKIDVIYEGAGVPRCRDAEEAAARLGLTPKKYFLFLGTLEPRKNIPTAIRAFVAFVRDNPAGHGDFRFVIAGRKGWKYDPILEAIEQANRDLAVACRDQAAVERINYLGYIKREDKSAVLGQALAFVFPSHYEGFGLPVIEAMSLGVPVITSNRASLPEICGDACILVDPADQPAMTTAMRRLVEDRQFAEDLSRRGRTQAARFDWDQTAHQTLATYERAVKEPLVVSADADGSGDDSDETTGFPLDRIMGM